MFETTNQISIHIFFWIIGGYSWNNINGISTYCIHRNNNVQVDIGSQTSTQEAKFLVIGLSG